MCELKLTLSQFKVPHKKGDFTWMIEQPKYKNSLFIYNDNEESFLSKTNKAGGGNAAIRPYSKLIPPRAAGIPTGSLKNHGYIKLTSKVRKIIDSSIENIISIIEEYPHINQIICSSDSYGNLGTGIFNVGEDVKTYILTQLRTVVNMFHDPCH